MPDDDCFTTELLVRLAAKLPNEITRTRSKDKDKTFGNSGFHLSLKQDVRTIQIAM
jgi:hypothetical protein